MTFYNRVDNLPPCLVRLLARKYGKAVTTEQLAELLHWNTWTTEALSQRTDWEAVDIYDLCQFTRACGVDFCNPRQMRRIDDYLRKDPTFQYLRVHPNWETYFKPLLKKWRAAWRGTSTRRRTLTSHPI